MKKRFGVDFFAKVKGNPVALNVKILLWWAVWFFTYDIPNIKEIIWLSQAVYSFFEMIQF